MQEKKNKTFVYIVGAGPGDPNLLTVKALDALKKADVILYDRLVSQQILNYANKKAEKVFVGKAPTKHRFPQEEINQLMLKYANEGKTIVRLKGGDPYIFGRGSEEALFLAEHKIPFEVIPGISAAIGASAYAGIPLTHRSLVTQVLFLTAHEDPSKPESQLDLQNIAKMKNTTIVIYMGAAKLETLVEELIKHGMSPNQTAAIVANATTARQKTLTGKLVELPEISRKNSLQPPLITIISNCTRFAETLNWFERKPLFGKKIVVTRATDQMQTIVSILTGEGAEIIPFPVFSTKSKPIEDPKFTNFLAQNFDWIIFTSRNGVRYFMENLKDRQIKQFHTLKFAAIGEKTAEELQNYNLFADFVPSAFNSDVFVDEFRRKFNLKKTRILRVKGTFENDPITKILKAECKRYETIDVYEIAKENPNKNEIQNLLNSQADGIIFTASITVKYFFDIVGEKEAISFLNKTKVFSIGPMTENALKSKGIENTYSSKLHTIEGIINLMKEIFALEEK
ncbi:MAG: uroporphyrinogen-III C-methyltransferase [Candidatus Kapaibacteriota bacterium]